MKLETTGRQVIPEILQPERLDASFALHVSRLKPDFAIVAAYAKILPLDIIKLPRLGAIGVHPSLLPKYRGATPIQSAILAGETETGVTLFMLDKKVDHGPILANRKLQIANGETYDTLMKELGGLSGNLLIETLPAFIAGNIAPQAQNEAAATYTKKFTTEDGFVDLQKDPPELVARKIRALNPAPGVYAFIEKNARRIRVKLLAAHLADGKLIPTLIQVEGKKPRAVRGMEDV
ncbi:MAG: methionyl-tRNA formyltransferase [Candidatus Harrisonbacteria bacterium]|nr:methionyl-tRNA formyltransferase [Candidatus Harrisonbacteria bacterium]